jgi:mono/diheme cytochrome c family protein
MMPITLAHLALGSWLLIAAAQAAQKPPARSDEESAKAPARAAAPAGATNEKGRAIAKKYCLSCHVLDADEDGPGLRDHVAGWTSEKAYESLGNLKKLNRMMPDFRGSDEERRTLAGYLSELGKRPAK